MANGFKAYRHVGGGIARLSGRSIATDYTTSIWNGDMVVLSGNNVTQAATNTAMVGTFLGCSYTAADGSIKFSPYWPGISDGKKDITAIINEDPNMTYVVLDSTGALTVGANCDLLDNGSEDATIGASRMSVTTSTNADFVVVSIVDADANLVEVKIV